MSNQKKVEGVVQDAKAKRRQSRIVANLGLDPSDGAKNGLQLTGYYARDIATILARIRGLTRGQTNRKVGDTSVNFPVAIGENVIDDLERYLSAELATTIATLRNGAKFAANRNKAFVNPLASSQNLPA